MSHTTETLETAMFRGFSFFSNHNEFHDLPDKSPAFAHFLHKQVCDPLSGLHDPVALLVHVIDALHVGDEVFLHHADGSVDSAHVYAQCAEAIIYHLLGKFSEELLQEVSTVATVPSKTLHGFVMEDYRPTFLTGLKATTQGNYMIYEDNYILPCMGDKPLRAINNKDVQEMMDWMANGKQNGLRQDIVHDTIERVKGHLHTLLAYAKDLDYISEIPIKDKLLRNNGKPSGHHTALSPNEYAEVRRNALTLSNRSQRLYACPLVYTGMRPEEIRGMKWELVNLKKGYCIVQEIVTYDARTKATIVSPTPKTEASARTILLPPPVVEAMRKEIRPCGYVIGAGRDPLAPLPYSTFKRLYTDTFKKLGLNGKCDNYDFRASYATWLKESGIELAHAADLMGQADTHMMSRVYAPTRHESIIMHQERISSLVESQLVAPS